MSFLYRAIERSTEPFPDDSREVPRGSLWRFVVFYSTGFRLPIALTALFAGLSSGLEVVLYGFVGTLVDWLASRDRAGFLESEQQTLLVMGGVCIILLPLFLFLNLLVRNQSVMGNFPMAIRWRMHHHLLSQSMKFYQDEFSGRVATKVMQTSLAVREIIVKSTDTFVYLIVQFSAMVALLATISLPLAVPLVVWSIFYVLILVYYLPKLAKVSQDQAGARSDMTGRIVDAYTNITTVKLFGHSSRESTYARSSMQTFLQTVYKQFRYVTGVVFLIGTLNYVLIFVSAAVSIRLWLTESTTLGAIAIAITLAMRAGSLSHWFMWEVAALFEQVGTALDGKHMMERPVDVQNQTDAPKLDVTKGEICFEDVDFVYDSYLTDKSEGEGEPVHVRKEVLREFCLTIKPGEKIGLVGRSGAGKSTLVNALLRFYDTSGGSIRIDGQDIREVTQESLRASIAMVTQDTSLLHRTIRENILYGRPEATEEELWCAICNAHVDGFVADLVDNSGGRGLDAQVGERGVKLSGGQRQRIAIARVLLKDAPILILDEATSALDSEVEAAIQESLNLLMKGKTVIAIAHRLSTIAEMDRLIIMDEGRIAEQGTHAELLAAKGIYAQLWERQTGGYIAGDE